MRDIFNSLKFNKLKSCSCFSCVKQAKLKGYIYGRERTKQRHATESQKANSNSFLARYTEMGFTP